jgi:hypothetical protein
MKGTQTGFSFVIPDVAADVTPVEAALKLTIEQTVQDDRAKVVGLTNHGQISRREQRLLTGECDSYLETYPGHYLMRMGRASPLLKEAMIAFLRSDEASVTDADVEHAVSRFVTRMLADLSTLNGLTEDDSLSSSEASRADAILQDYQARVHELRRKLGRRARSPR